MTILLFGSFLQASGSAAVRESGADLGIVFDTDVDRSAIVDSSGREINR